MKLLGDLLSVGRNYLHLACGEQTTTCYLLGSCLHLCLQRAWGAGGEISDFGVVGTTNLRWCKQGYIILSLWKRQFKITRSRSSMDLHVLQVLRCTSFSESFRIFSLFAINVCFLPDQDIHVSIGIKWHIGWYLTTKNENQNIVIPIQSKFKHSDGQCLKPKTPILFPLASIFCLDLCVLRPTFSGAAFSLCWTVDTPRSTLRVPHDTVHKEHCVQYIPPSVPPHTQSRAKCPSWHHAREALCPSQT